MIKRLSLLFVLVMAAIVPITVASSQPLVSTGYGSSELLLISDADIRVQSEHISFNFLHGNTYNDSALLEDEGVTAEVTATYKFVNEGSSQFVQIGYPLIGSVTSIKDRIIRIQSQDQDIEPSAYYYGSRTDIESYSDLSGADMIEDAIIEPDLSQISGYYYEFKKTDSTYTVSAEIELNQCIIEDSFDSFSSTVENGEVRVQLNQTPGSGNSSVFILGAEEKQISHSNLVFDTEMTLAEYLLKTDYEYSEADEAMLFQEAKRLKKSSEYVISDFTPLTELRDEDRLLIIAFELMMEGEGAETDLNLFYAMEPICKIYFRPKKYTYYYFTNTLDTWSDYGTVTVNVFTDRYICNSTFLFFEVGDYQQSAEPYDFSEQNHQFSISTTKFPIDTSEMSKIGEFIVFLLLFGFLIFVLPIPIIAVIAIIVIRRKRRKRIEQEMNQYYLTKK